MESNPPPPLNYHQRHLSTVARPPPVPEFSFFRDHLRPAGHMFPAYGGAPQIGGPSYQYVNDHHRHPIGMHEAIWRHIEKERIREEIIAEEIARRRVLEAEVRRELMIERELAMQRGGDGSFYTSHLKSMIVAPKDFPALPPPKKMDRSTHEEWTDMSVLVRHEFGRRETSSERVSEPRNLELVTPSDTVKEKQKIILLAKPEEKCSGMIQKAEVLPTVSAKRKAEEVFMPVGTSEITPAGSSSNKKVKEEWSCALCQVSSTSERALNEHLQGKRHKAKEAGLRKNGKNFSIGLYPKTKPMPNKLPQIPNSPCLDKGVYIAESKKPKAAVPAEANSEKTEAKSDRLVVRSRKLDRTMKNNAQACGTRRTRKEINFKFWCEMCQIGAFSEKIMETHRNGKKHLTRLLEQNTVSKPSTQTMQATKEINPTEEDGKVVECTASRDSAPGINDVELDCQKEAAEDGEDIASKGFCLVADEVELEGNQNEDVKVEEGATSESLNPVTDEVELEGEQKVACEDDAEDAKSESSYLVTKEVELEDEQKEACEDDAEDTKSECSYPVANEVELEGEQKEACEDYAEDTKSECSYPVANEVELEGEQKEACEDYAEDTKSECSYPVINEVELECDQKEESITDADNSD
ncbi:hypothetical protein LIER_11969 [Lithospermum erythrorhizon]|uniref:U1-type domain-containing protein n=1 Tax=Lithospermum erythrorhizon TaxID=34254 RepID=A0AAV3PQ04_LITER